MKNLRAILASLGLAALFAAALAALSLLPSAKPGAGDSYLSGIDPVSVTSVEIDRATRSGARIKIKLVRVAGRWHIEEPVKAEADAESVSRMLDDVLFAEPKDSLSVRDAARLGRSVADFGLGTPRIAATFRSGEKSETIHFGSAAASGAEVFARRDGEDFVLTVSASVAESAGRSVRDFRRRNLFSFSPGDVADVGLKNAGEPFSKLVRGKDGWRLAEPVDAPADRSVAEDLLAAVCGARILEYARPSESMNVGLGADEGSYTISLRNSLGAIEKVVFGAPSGTNGVWALSPEGAPVKLSADLVEKCRTCQRTIEDTRAFPADAASVTSISISKGFPAYMLTRKSATDPWRLVSPVDAPADAANAGALLEKILSVRGMDVTAEATGSVSVSVGTAATNFPPCTLSPSFLPPGTKLADLRDRLLIRYPREKVRRIKVNTAAGNEWVVRGGASQGALHEILALLSDGIVAERVESVMLKKEDFSAFGFDDPSYTIAFELDDSESSMRMLLLGSASPDGGRYATVGGSDAAFALSAATVSALTRPEMETLKERK